MFGIQGPVPETLGLLLASVALIVSWAFLQVVFALNCAHEFYVPNAQSSNAQFVFPDSRLPDYWSFVRLRSA